MKKFFKGVYADHLYRNSLYLILNNVVTTGFGFFFWMICARLFSASQVGYATAIISAIGLVASFSYLGLNTALVRYLPKSHDKDRLIGSCINLTALASIVMALIFLLLVPFVSPKLMFIVESPLFFVMFVAYTLFWVLFSVVNSVFIADRRSGVVLAKSIVFSVLKLGLPVVLVFLGSFGILGAYYFSALIGFVFSLFFFKYKLVIDFSLIKEMFKFSFGNYVAGILGLMPALVLPIMILNMIGPSASAHFYVAWMIAGLLFFIPGAVSQALLAEGSYNATLLKEHVRKAYLFSFLLLIPGIVFVLVFGKYMLLLFGEEYSVEGLKLLQVLALSGIFVTLNSVKVACFNVAQNIRKIILQNVVIASVTIIGSLIFGDAHLLIFGLMYGFGQVAGVMVR